MVLMRFLIIIFTIFLNLVFLNKSVLAKDFQFRIPQNNITLKRAEPFKTEDKTIDRTNAQAISADHLTNYSENLYLINQNQKFLLKEFFNPNLMIKIKDSYAIDFSKGTPLALTFEYLVNSEETLLAFDEPVFYLALEGEAKKELIFAKTIKQSKNDWQKVILDLRNYDLNDKKLVFYAGNLPDEERESVIYLKNLSSKLIIWRTEDQVFLDKNEIKDIAEHLIREHLEINDQIWPIYQYRIQEIADFRFIPELDGSLTFLFSATNELILKNHQWLISCGDGERQLLTQLNYFLLPQFIIKDFWPNLTDKVLINTQDFHCDDLDKLTLEFI